MFREKAKERLINQIAEETGAIEAVTEIVAGLEEELLGEIAALHGAQGTEYYDELPAKEERQESLQALVKAQLSGNAEDYYAENELPNHLENADDAKAYLGMDTDGWEEQKTKWADGYRDTLPEEATKDASNDEIAAAHVKQQFGVSIKEFEARVVEWEPGEMLEHMIAGNMRSATAGIRHAREQIEQSETDE